MFKFFKFLISLLLIGIFAVLSINFLANNVQLPDWANEFLTFRKNDPVEEVSDIVDKYTIDISNGLSLSEDLKQGFQFFNIDFINNMSDEDIIPVENLGNVIRNKLYDYGFSNEEIQQFLDTNLPHLAGYSKYVSIVFDDISNNLNLSNNKISFYIIRRDTQ